MLNNNPKVKAIRRILAIKGEMPFILNNKVIGLDGINY